MLGAVLWQATEFGARATALAGASRRFTGSYPSKRTDGFPTVSWLNDVPPSIEPARWSLVVSGAVERPISWGYEDLAADSTIKATIDCTGGWYSEQIWSGVPLSEILQHSQPNASASSVTVRSVTGYHRRFSLEEAGGYLLATHVGGRPLDRGHGFPARLVAPGKREFEWIKWVTSVEVNESPHWLQWPLPLQ